MATEALNNLIANLERAALTDSEVGIAESATALKEARKALKRYVAATWQDGVETALNYAKRDPNGITLHLRHFDGSSWRNPYKDLRKARDVRESRKKIVGQNAFPVSETRQEVRAAVKAARKAATGDSNDDEIAKLQEAMELGNQESKKLERVRQIIAKGEVTCEETRGDMEYSGFNELLEQLVEALK